MDATPATLEFEGTSLVLVKDGVRLGFRSEDVALLWDAAHWLATEQNTEYPDTLRAVAAKLSIFLRDFDSGVGRKPPSTA